MQATTLIPYIRCPEAGYCLQCEWVMSLMLGQIWVTSLWAYADNFVEIHQDLADI